MLKKAHRLFLEAEDDATKEIRLLGSALGVEATYRGGRNGNPE
jgi:hypothetical protein